MKLAFVILAHDHPANAARLARVLLESGSDVSIHFDLKAGGRAVAEVKAGLGDLADRLIWANRVKVAWGEWSIVEATLNGVQAIFDSGASPDYIHLMSAADYPIRPIGEFASFLERHKGTDFIESHAIARGDWVKGGLTKERYLYRHYFNFRKRPKLFGLSWRAQAALHWRKKVPAGLTMRMGSQWCTLTAASWRHVLKAGADPGIRNFFRRSWIPDEMYVQTLLTSAETPHSNRHLTLYQFNDYGVPVVYHGNHAGYLLRQPFFFARKLSPHAMALRDSLDQVVLGARAAAAFADHQIGTPTEEYETFRSIHRKGLKGLRIPGLVKDAWYGDLEWNNKPYVAIYGSSAAELETVASAIDGIPGLICHRFLFAADHIGFARGLDRFAGYGKRDTALRDHKPENFLADVINGSPDLTTCFLVLVNDAMRKRMDVMRWDSNARLVHVQGGLLRGFKEQFGSLDLAHGGKDRPDEQGRTAVQYFAQYYDSHQAFLEKNIQSLREGKAQFSALDILDPGWPSDLDAIVAGLGHDLPGSAARVRALSPESEARRSLDLPLALLRDILDAARGKDEKRRLVAEIMAQPKAPYLVILGSSRLDAARLAAALQSASVFQFESGRNPNLPDALASLLNRSADGPSGPRILVFGLEDGLRTDAFLNDPDARVVFLSGPPEQAALELIAAHGSARQDAGGGNDDLRKWCDPVIFQRLLAEARAAIMAVRNKARHAAAPVIEVDPSKSGWNGSLAAFIAGAFREPDADAGGMARTILSCWKRKAGLEPAAAFAAYRNADYLHVIASQAAMSASPPLEAEDQKPVFETGEGKAHA